MARNERKSLKDLSPGQVAFITGDDSGAKPSEGKESPAIQERAVLNNQTAATPSFSIPPESHAEPTQPADTPNSPIRLDEKDLIWVQHTTKLPHHVLQALKDEARRRQSRFEKPDTQQGILTEALAEWFERRS
ncbi:MAG: hypothetical protein KDN22_10045 [Verrucomicrobiae bacterium]|nr:hypothetical protein [Verrucomicrobiae bacterium]